jgi:hypothetical protein
MDRDCHCSTDWQTQCSIHGQAQDFASTATHAPNCLLTNLTVSRHIQEIELIRGKVYSLEQQHNQMKAK